MTAAPPPFHPMRHIHVISFQNPTPPDYGGVIDVFHKLRALRDAGWRITLHAFHYAGRNGRPECLAPEDEFIMYEREEGLLRNLGLKPYIVASRRDPRLLGNLLKDNDPVLFEGLHTCGLLDHPALKERLKIVRTHNVEHDYYRGLAEASGSIKESLFFRLESARLRRFEKILAHADIIASISPADHRYFSTAFPEAVNLLLPCFYDDSAPERTPGTGHYVFYHGNLSVKENEKAAERIIRGIAPRVPEVKFIIAGKNPGEALIESAADSPNVELTANPDNDTLNRMLTDARVNLLITHQPTGIKLKLLNSLRRGAHVIANTPMVANTGLEHLVVTADTDEELAEAIREKTREPFASQRQLPPMYSNSDNIRRLISIL